jgi:hypothetical protein
MSLTATSATEHKQTFPRLFTRKEGAKVIRDELGIPFPESRWDKDAMDGLAPKPSAIYGRVHLYTRDQVLEYGRSLIRPVNADEDEAA